MNIFIRILVGISCLFGYFEHNFFEHNIISNIIFAILVMIIIYDISIDVLHAQTNDYLDVKAILLIASWNVLIPVIMSIIIAVFVLGQDILNFVYVLGISFLVVNFFHEKIRDYAAIFYKNKKKREEN